MDDVGQFEDGRQLNYEPKRQNCTESNSSEDLQAAPVCRSREVLRIVNSPGLLAPSKFLIWDSGTGTVRSNTDTHHLNDLFTSEEAVLARNLERRSRFLANGVRLIAGLVRRIKKES